jgi:hypothetical protein
LSKGQPTINPAFRYIANPGIVNITEINGATGIGHTSGINEKNYFGITNVFGYQIDRNFFGGAGLGYFSYGESQFVPLYLDYRFSVYLKEATPYLFADGGLLVDPTELISGTKMFLNPGIGISRTVSSKFEILFATGIIVQMGNMMPRASFYNFKLGIIFRKNSFMLFKAGSNIKYF